MKQSQFVIDSVRDISSKLKDIADVMSSNNAMPMSTIVDINKIHVEEWNNNMHVDITYDNWGRQLELRIPLDELHTLVSKIIEFTIFPDDKK